MCSYASDARRYHNDSAACDALLNMSAWHEHDEFLQRFAGASFTSLLGAALRNNPNFTLPPSLLELHMHMTGEATLPGGGAAQDILQMARGEEDELLWSGPNAPGGTLVLYLS